jgi:hypothetical protein
LHQTKSAITYHRSEFQEGRKTEHPEFRTFP